MSVLFFTLTLDFILSRELITNCNPKFLSKFWTTLFKKLGVKLFYSIAYYSQTDRSSERRNQTIEIVLQFFIQAFYNPGLWLQVLPRIQTIINNTSSFSNRKTPNTVAYGFFPCRFFDFLAAFLTLDALATCADVLKAVSFALLNQKMTYNQKYPPLFIKIDN